MKKTKLYITIDPNAVEKQALSCISQELRAQFRSGLVNTWEMLHITLHYFGEVPEDRIADIVLSMKKIAAGLKNFTMLTGRPGFFGPKDSATVWIGLTEGAEELSTIHAKLEKLLAKAGFPAEDRPYTPHVTLGREIDVNAFDPPVGETQLASVNLSAHALTLLKSRVVGGKPVYEPLAVVPFKGK